MADYGMKVWNASSNLVLDLTDKITRLRYTTIAPADTNASIILSDIDGISTIQFSLAAETDFDGLTHLVTRNGTKILWKARGNEASPYTPYEYVSVDSTILVFMYT